jgi:hypothetical protein
MKKYPILCTFHIASPRDYNSPVVVRIFFATTPLLFLPPAVYRLAASFGLRGRRLRAGEQSEPDDEGTINRRL